VYAEEEATLLIDAAPSSELAQLVARRVAGEPLEHLVGWATFAGLRVVVEPGVFVPRPRTELLAREAATLAGPGATVVDLCCGSGAVGAALLASNPSIDLYAVDVDPVAVHCARRNVGDRVRLGDLYDALPDRLRGAMDVVVANAPYVPSEQIALMPPEARDHEPRPTLDGGADGLDVVRRVVAGAPDWLAPGGQLLFEVGRSQVELARRLCRAAGLLPRVVGSEQATVVIARPSTEA
jgi:release factor glutamine methyltransferase